MTGQPLHRVRIREAYQSGCPGTITLVTAAIGSLYGVIYSWFVWSANSWDTCWSLPLWWWLCQFWKCLITLALHSPCCITETTKLQTAGCERISAKHTSDKRLEPRIHREMLVFSRSVVSTLQPHGLQPVRLLCPWDFPGKNTGVGCHFLLQGISPAQGSSLHLLHWQKESLPLSQQGSPIKNY